MLLLVFGAAVGQDEAAAAAEGEVADVAEASEGAESAEGKSGEGVDEEAWQYVEFLKTDVK